MMKGLNKDQRKSLADFLANFSVAWLATGVIVPVVSGSITERVIRSTSLSLAWSVVLLLVMFNLLRVCHDFDVQGEMMMNFFKFRTKISESSKPSAGQAVLIVLLVIAVALGFGLSIISQSVTDAKISKQEQEAARAFSAAEAGIEEALKSISIGSGNLTVDGVEVSYTVEGETALNIKVSENESVEVDLVGALAGLNTLTVNWVDSNSNTENPGTCTATTNQAPASLLITVTDDVNQVARYGVNSCALSVENGMTDVVTSGDSPFLRQYDVPVDANDVLVRIRPVYNQASITVAGNVELANQAYTINSTAQAPTLESKAIKVTRSEPATPSVFDYVLFSGTNIVK